jgi:hypothetical protein
MGDGRWLHDGGHTQLPSIKTTNDPAFFVMHVYSWLCSYLHRHNSTACASL